MRLIPSFFAALVTLSALAACGTKTPLSLPPQPQTASKAATVVSTPVPAADDSNKATADPRR
jgi:predicted small lipoprotein YifL